MARLIIGHVTDSSVRIWVRGDRRYPVAYVTLRPGRFKPRQLELEPRHGYTGIVEITGLTQDKEYRCEVRFARLPNTDPLHWVNFGHCEGRFRTLPQADTPLDFSFLLGSCNLHSLGPFSNPDKAFETLTRVGRDENIRFMIHCGDQIYYDIPLAGKAPDHEEYREKYLDAWGDSRPTRKFLTQHPQYMILDDHEITDDFANDMVSPNPAYTPSDYLDKATKVYREFVHIRHPQVYGNQALYYHFDVGCSRFFVMDVRTERFRDPTISGETQIIGDTQMEDFKQWLADYKDDVKFVVTSVPFVSEVRNDRDKWSAPHFRHQREEILQFIWDEKISGVVFLTGDMHNSLHSTLNLSKGTRKIRVHELMSSPINQLQKTAYWRYRPRSQSTLPEGIKVVSTVDRKEFYAEHSNAMLIRLQGRTVNYEVFRTKRDARAELHGHFKL